MAPSPTLRRLAKEVAELNGTTNPTPTFHAAPVSDSNLHEWHFTLLGPPSPSPYAGGLYHGRISLPPQYPLKPPNFRFLTPSGRFEVNREICLSISGFHEETWQPAWGIRTALVALRSFMAEKGSAGQVGGLESSEEVRKRLAGESRRWKCQECGKSNGEVMNEWWQQCREAGVKVDEEGMVLEALPEGVELKAREGEVKHKGKQKEDELIDTTNQAQTQKSQSDDSEQIVSLSVPNTTRSAIAPSQPAPSRHQSPTTNTDAPLPVQNMSTSNRPQVQNTQFTPTFNQDVMTTNPANSADMVTLDRAISVVFFALCIMILKKIFYPAPSHPSWDGGNVGMEKDW